MQAVDGSISALSSESTDKAAIQAAAVNAAGELHPVSLIVTFDSTFDVNSLQSAGQVIHRYQKVFNGASLVTMSNQVEAIANMTGITGVYLDEMRKIDTDATPSFDPAVSAWNTLGGQQNAGEGITVGILDMGICEIHLSLSDPDPSGKTLSCTSSQARCQWFCDVDPRIPVILVRLSSESE